MPTILITGTSRGLGLEFVRQYAADGWRVLAVVRDPLSGRGASDAGGEVHVADAADSRSLERLRDSLGDTRLDVVLANAGIYGSRQSLADLDGGEFLKVMHVNALGPLLLARTFAPLLTGPKIFAAVSSMMGSITDNSSGGEYAYRASKAALNMVIKGLSVDLRKQGATAIALSPGWVRTDMGGAHAPLDPPAAIAGMRAVLAGITPAQSGGFFHYDGSQLPW